MAKNKQKKTGPEFSAQLSMAGETATLTVAGCIGWDTEAVEFTDKVKEAKESGATRLVVRINSLGGYCYDGLAMGDCLKTCGMETVAEVYGTAQSMASYLVQCCTVRKAHQNATLMFHQPSAGVYGTVDEIMTQAVHLVKMRDQMFADMAARCGSTGPELSAEHQSMKIYTAEEALAKGFLDEVERGENSEAEPTPVPAPEPEPATDCAAGLLDYGGCLRMAMCGDCAAPEPEPEPTPEPAPEPAPEPEPEPTPEPTQEDISQMVAEQVKAEMAKREAELLAQMGASPAQLPGGQATGGAVREEFTIEELDAMPAMKRMAVLSTRPALAAKYALH